MPARDAAIAFVTDCPDKDPWGIKFEIDEPNARPPAKGEIGIRWIDGNHYAPRQEGVMILRFDGDRSALLMSHVEVVGRPSKQEVERAVMKTDFHEIRPLVAQQTYEILWWLRHVRSVGSSNRGVSSSNDDYGRFWMKPDGPVTDMAILGEPCHQWIDAESHWQGAFAYALIQRLAERSGIKQRYPIPKVVRYVDNDPDSIFLRTTAPPDANDQEASKKWVGRLLVILQNPKRDFLHYSVLELLVPLYDPMRYSDDRINGALVSVLQQSERASAALRPPPENKPEPELDDSKFRNPKALEKAKKARRERLNKRWLEGHDFRERKSDLDSNAQAAAAKLGLRDAVSAFPDVLRLSPQEAALIVARHPELKPKFVDYLQPLMSGESPGWAIDPIWRADLREFTPWLEKLAQGELLAGRDPTVQHEAETVLMAWRETDPLTKTKLDIMLTGKIGNADPIPEILRNEFEALSPEDKAAIRNFVTWLRTIKVPWMRKYLENVFTPHTPRTDNPLER